MCHRPIPFLRPRSIGYLLYFIYHQDGLFPSVVFFKAAHCLPAVGYPCTVRSRYIICRKQLVRNGYILQYLFYYRRFPDLTGTQHDLNELSRFFNPVFNYLIFSSFIHSITFYAVECVFLRSANIINLSDYINLLKDNILHCFFAYFLAVDCTCFTAGACVLHTLLIGECRTKRIISKRHCIRMAETEPFGRFPVRTWFIMRPALSFHASKSSEYGPATPKQGNKKNGFSNY